MKNQKCVFKITELLDKRSDGSELEVGNIYHGEIDANDNVWYTDETGDEWVFYPGETCMVVSMTKIGSFEDRVMSIIDTLKKNKIKVTVSNISTASLFSAGGTITTKEEIELVKKIMVGYKPGQIIMKLE